MRTLLISTAAHGAALAVLARWTLDVPATTVKNDAGVPTVELMAMTPIEVTVVEAHATGATIGSTGDRPPVRGPRQDHEVTTGPARPIETAGSGSAATQPSPLAMRGRRHDLTLSPDTAERIAAGGGSRARAEEPGDESRWAHDPKIKLRPSGGGRHQILDVTAKIDVAADGTVDLKSKPHFSAKLNVPSMANLRAQRDRIKDELSAWVADPHAGTRVGSRQDLPAHLQAVQGACEQWNDPMCFTAQDQHKVWAAQDRALTGKVGSLVEVSADVTGYLMNRHAGDPYASRKLKILDQTRDERVRIGKAYRAEQLARSAELVRKNLVALWGATADHGQRRAALFEIWDECGEGTDSAGAAGERARAVVIGWIRERLPRGDEAAYTTAEIDKLNARRTSRQRFVPYE